MFKQQDNPSTIPKQKPENSHDSLPQTQQTSSNATTQKCTSLDEKTLLGSQASTLASDTGHQSSHSQPSSYGIGRWLGQTSHDDPWSASKVQEEKGSEGSKDQYVTPAKRDEDKEKDKDATG
ncbi:hypothetical protein MMC28_006871 [Mycoblastus sanguinarius]|nr:hypothetical protein [Mycoblastus sanguinarius]